MRWSCRAERMLGVKVMRVVRVVSGEHWSYRGFTHSSQTLPNTPYLVSLARLLFALDLGESPLGVVLCLLVLRGLRLRSGFRVWGMGFRVSGFGNRGKGLSHY